MTPFSNGEEVSQQWFVSEGGRDIIFIPKEWEGYGCCA